MPKNQGDKNWAVSGSNTVNGSSGTTFDSGKEHKKKSIVSRYETIIRTEGGV